MTLAVTKKRMFGFTTILAVLVSSVFPLTTAQNLSIPATWRKPNNSRTLSARISTSQSAINAILPQLVTSTSQFNGIAYWQSGNVWSAMANQDHFAHTITNRAHVVSNLKNAFARYANYDQFQYNDDALWWAQAALYAYRAYGDTALLNNAVATWKHVTPYVITAAQARAGSTPVKTFSLAHTCEGSSMAGGVFWRPTTNDQSVNSITTGLYMTVSALLAEITRDSAYKNAAVASADWIRRLNLHGNIVLDSVNAHSCARSPANWIFTYNSGKYVEGLSVLAGVTGDAQWRTLMVNVVAAAVKSTIWQGSNGIITEGASTATNNDGVGFKAIFIRGLNEAYVRNPANTALRNLIRGYIDVQYNALLDLAAKDNAYSSSWPGPPQGFTTWGQLAALDVLVSAIDDN